MLLLNCPMVSTTALCVSVVLVAILAHNLAARLEGGDLAASTRTVTGCAALVAVNLALAALVPSTRNDHTRIAGVACLAAFAASYQLMLVVHLLCRTASGGEPCTLRSLGEAWVPVRCDAGPQLDGLMRLGYLCFATLAGSLSAATTACRLLDPWNAARQVHAAHAAAYAAYVVGAFCYATDGTTEGKGLLRG